MYIFLILHTHTHTLSLSLSLVSFFLSHTRAHEGLPALTHVEQMLNNPLVTSPIETIIFMDNIMIDMHGPEATKKMRALGYLGPVIALTGNLVQTDIDHYLGAGATRSARVCFIVCFSLLVLKFCIKK